jgi:hypothetical protein
MRTTSAGLAIILLAGQAAMAEGLTGKSYIIELSSSQYDSGYGAYLVPPLVRALDRAGLRSAGGPGADLVANIVTESDVGQWIGEGDAREWTHTVRITVGLSPESYVIPFEGTPAFGVTATLLTPNPDREDELDCLIGLAARTAIANYRPEGHLRTDGSACLRN